MIRALIFDCFGVLISDALEAIVSQLRDQQPEVARQIIDTINAASRGYISRQESSQQVSALLGISVDEYITRIKQDEVKNQQLLDYILELRGSYKSGLLSNISGGGLAVRFTPEELQTYFDVVVASGDIGYAKPAPEAYRITAERLDVATKECIFIDDRLDYCEGAKQAGMQAICYESFGQLHRDLTASMSTAS